MRCIRQFPTRLWAVMALAWALPAMALAGAGEPWEIAHWVPLATGADGAQHFIADDSLLRLPHTPHIVSFYRKIVFPEAREFQGVVADSEIADVVVDCQSGRMDVISATQTYQGMVVSRRYYRQENARRVKLDTLGEDALRSVCGDQLPRYVRRKDHPPPIGSDPEGLQR